MALMKIAVLPGDDIGPEITDATLAVLEAADRRFALDLGFDVVEVGMAAHCQGGLRGCPAPARTHYGGWQTPRAADDRGPFFQGDRSRSGAASQRVMARDGYRRHGR